MMEMNALTVMPVMDLKAAIDRRNQMVAFVKEIMIESTDYGKIPGTEKPTLYKPGAEKLTTFFGLIKRFQIIEKVEDWTGANHAGEPFFYYLYRCGLHRGDILIAEADGSCSSFESKYRYRKGERLCPNCEQPNIRKSKKDDGWYCWVKTGGCGAIFKGDDPAIANQEVGRIRNPDVCDQVNTIQKMAQKRALVAATLLAVNASEFFNQDLEDYVDDTIVDVKAEVVEQKPQTKEQPKTNGNGHKNGVDTPASPAKLLEFINKRVEVPYDNVSHLYQAIKKASGGEYSWPNPKDKDGWEDAKGKALKHAESKTSAQPPAIEQEPLFEDGSDHHEGSNYSEEEAA